jgi:hypothetical protein
VETKYVDISPLLENIRQIAHTVKNGLFRDLTDASFTIAIEANSKPIGAEKIIEAIAQLAYALHHREVVFGLSPTTCEQLDKIMAAIHPGLAALAVEKRAHFSEWLGKENKELDKEP